ncbi:SRPBCC family protein [Saccharothrix variisporea]|uniref:Polyketide cyclase/dehydrase/lipid transport protein n=1 Tax=Saccharothrix variisporea TaxID=543527 RepID=A0A495X9R3_9PSEU|nr:SRPBCC family protein [Saccharothrix variisporea]RKT70970.1 polyketide cyclase/dehydrase/lipid transport protein [Saccharothrix variisporea]
MTPDWPTTGLDPVRRLRATAAGVRGAAVTERVLAADPAEVWALLTDFEDAFTRIQPDMRAVEVVERRGDRVVLRAASRFGLRARLVGVQRPGWCWLQSRFLVIAMAAAPEPGGGTRVALTGGVRLPRRPAIVPWGVRRESTRSLDALQALLDR